MKEIFTKHIVLVLGTLVVIFAVMFGGTLALIGAAKENAEIIGNGSLIVMLSLVFYGLALFFGKEGDHL